ncbi:hypothetical protein CBM2597_P170001 [Cupriavidus taiwanensis]|uniref:Transposase n=1 Tax=Cupriavidus taiwanensis TaxID=164546 RepID=A0A7Z7NPN4_9BURK|nr:hypothetical protein CBM2597_P170001 [Cupriavidus taiwanensis]SPC25166.1 hypothetical protein CBM2594_P150001 [Cupriavidus taiwanensis]
MSSVFNREHRFQARLSRRASTLTSCANGFGIRDSAQAQGALPAFVPVVEEVLDSRPIKTPAQVVASGDPPPRRAQPLALLSAKLPNGVSLELECSERDVGLVKAMIEALSGGH